MSKVIFVEDGVLRDTFWNAAIDLKKQNDVLKDRVQHLENIIIRAHMAFFSHSSDRKASAAMQRILDEEVRKEAKP